MPVNPQLRLAHAEPPPSHAGTPAEHAGVARGLRVPDSLAAIVAGLVALLGAAGPITVPLHG